MKPFNCGAEKSGQTEIIGVTSGQISAGLFFGRNFLRFCFGGKLASSSRWNVKLCVYCAKGSLSCCLVTVALWVGKVSWIVIYETENQAPKYAGRKKNGRQKGKEGEKFCLRNYTTSFFCVVQIGFPLFWARGNIVPQLPESLFVFFRKQGQ